MEMKSLKVCVDVQRTEEMKDEEVTSDNKLA